MIAKQNHYYFVDGNRAVIKAGQELKAQGIITQAMIDKTLEQPLYANDKAAKKVKMNKVPSPKYTTKK